MFSAAAVEKVGTVKAFGGSTAPDGWLFCDGSAISRTTYAELFSVIGTTYGAGDGSTTFNIPNGVMPVGTTAQASVFGTNKALVFYNGVVNTIITGNGGNNTYLYRAYNSGNPYVGAMNQTTIQPQQGLQMGFIQDSTYGNSGIVGSVNLNSATAATSAIIKY